MYYLAIVGAFISETSNREFPHYILKKKKELPDDYFVLTLGLPFPLETQRIVIITEPYPDRYTNHILISETADIDDELFSWLALAYDFSNSK